MIPYHNTRVTIMQSGQNDLLYSSAGEQPVNDTQQQPSVAASSTMTPTVTLPPLPRRPKSPPKSSSKLVGVNGQFKGTVAVLPATTASASTSAVPTHDSASE